MAQRLARTMRDLGAVTLLKSGRVTWYETERLSSPLGERTLLRWGGGLIRTVTSSPMAEDGEAALRSARALNLLGITGKGAASSAGRPPEARAVRDAFVRMFPRGVTYATDEPVPAELAALSSRECRSILTEAIHFATHLDGGGRARGFDVTSFCSDGELKLIFVVGRDDDARKRRRWRTLVRALNLGTAFAPAPVKAPA
jgi:hypothetical protein